MAAKKKASGPADAGFAGFEAKALKPIAAKIKKLKAGYKISEGVRAVVGEAATPHAVVCYLVRAGHLDPIPNGTLLEYLAGDDLDEATAVAVAEALAARDEAGKGVEIRSSSLDWLPGWPSELDGLVYRAYGVAPAAFAERTARFSPATRRGVAFVARRRGADIDAAMAAEIATELANAQAKGYGITLNVDCPFVGDDGSEVALSVGDLSALRTLALRFVTAEAWDKALIEATLRNEWGLLENVDSALEQLPLAEITRLFATRFTMFGDSSSADEHIAALMDRRSDTPEELLADLAHVPESERDAEELRAVYAAAAARKRGK